MVSHSSGSIFTASDLAPVGSHHSTSGVWLVPPEHTISLIKIGPIVVSKLSGEKLKFTPGRAVKEFKSPLSRSDYKPQRDIISQHFLGIPESIDHLQLLQETVK